MSAVAVRSGETRLSGDLWESRRGCAPLRPRGPLEGACRFGVGYVRWWCVVNWARSRLRPSSSGWVRCAGVEQGKTIRCIRRALMVSADGKMLPFAATWGSFGGALEATTPAALLPCTRDAAFLLAAVPVGRKGTGAQGEKKIEKYSCWQSGHRVKQKTRKPETSPWLQYWWGYCGLLSL